MKEASTMDIQNISSSEVFTSQIRDTQKLEASSESSSDLTALKSERATQDTYVPEDSSAKDTAGIYQLVTDSTGSQTISFDAPVQSTSSTQASVDTTAQAAAEQAGGAMAAGGAGGASGASGSSSSSSTADDIQDEIDDLEEQKAALEKQLQSAGDEDAQAKLQKQIDQLDTQIQAKEAELLQSESEEE
jgi:hypothetical protein